MIEQYNIICVNININIIFYILQNWHPILKDVQYNAGNKKLKEIYDLDTHHDKIIVQK